MKRVEFYFVFILLFSMSIFACEKNEETSVKPEDILKKISWYGQSAFEIKAEKIIYLDPVSTKITDSADIILITHPHGDHFDLASIARINKASTQIIAPKDCAADIKKKFNKDITVLEPGKSLKIGNINIEAVSAYNIVKTNHQKSSNWVGYIVTVEGIRIYHAGDTERIPEMKTYKADIAILPLGQTYTMVKVEDAADAALDVQAKIAIPMHFGMYEGKSTDADKFNELLQGKVNAVIMTKI